jgi:hypothetical protein
MVEVLLFVEACNFEWSVVVVRDCRMEGCWICFFYVLYLLGAYCIQCIDMLTVQFTNFTMYVDIRREGNRKGRKEGLCGS